MDTKIQELTDKIYKEGVEKGNEEAGRIIADANAQKQAILTEAEAEAKRIVAQAEKQAAELKKNTEAELKLFATQSVEALKSEVVNLITGKITSSNVKAIVSNTAFMQKVILEMAKEWVAAPGYSEHQLGFAVDINGATYDLYFWLQENSYKYGFIFRYPGSKTDITGTAEEVWHYRYVGKEAAAEIYEQQICLEEYLERIKE